MSIRFWPTLRMAHLCHCVTSEHAFGGHTLLSQSHPHIHKSHICRVGQNPTYLEYIQDCLQGFHQIYSHIRRICTVLVNPTLLVKCSEGMACPYTSHTQMHTPTILLQKPGGVRQASLPFANSHRFRYIFKVAQNRMYIHIYTPYIWWFPQPKNPYMHRTYIWFWPTLEILHSHRNIRCTLLPSPTS